MNKIIKGDCLVELKNLKDNSVDSIVTDPPYELGFMGKSWDSTGIANNLEMWAECLRVLKPGGHLLAFSGTRTYHRMASAIEDAGFEVRDMIEWVYGSGFPKSLNIGKAVDKLQGNERKLLKHHIQSRTNPNSKPGSVLNEETSGIRNNWTVTKGTSPWEGWGTALKPAHEPICMARKPLSEKTVAENCLKWGTGGINIDESRVEITDTKNGFRPNSANKQYTPTDSFAGGRITEQHPQGRFPANLCHDNSEEVRECFPETKSQQRAGKRSGKETGIMGAFMGQDEVIMGHNDSGNASRFFKSIIYQAKATKNQRYSLLTCNCQTVKLEAWQKQDQNQKEKMGGISQEADTSGNFMKGDLDSNMILSGSNTTGQSLKDTTSIILTETNSTITSQTSNSLHQQNTREYTEGAKSEMENGGSHANFVQNSNQSQQNTGTSQKKDGHCTGVAVSATLAKLYRKSVCSNCGGEVKSSGHPTQKPIALMEYLITMVTPKGGIVLDPFAGSGSTLVAAKQNGYQYIGIEMTEEYIPIIEARLNSVNVKLL